MNRIMKATATHSQAARAAGLTDRTLRNWIDRRLVAPQGDTGRSEGAWRQFSAYDVFRLAIIGRLVAYGASIEEAVAIVRETIDESARKKTLLARRAAMTGTAIYVNWRDDGRHVFFYRGQVDDRKLAEFLSEYGAEYARINVMTMAAITFVKLEEMGVVV